jgi:hypothetical protein
MTAFETAWALTKEWSPSWRDRAEELPLLEDMNFAERNDTLMGEGTSLRVHPHPLDSRFVVKTPHPPSRRMANMWDKSKIRPDEYNDALMATARYGLEHEQEGNKGLPAFMEQLGFPVASEMYVENPDNMDYLIQPKMGYDNRDSSFDELRDYKNIGEFALESAFGDKGTPSNWAEDPKGLERLLDFGTDVPDYWDWDGVKNTWSGKQQKDIPLGEWMQESLDQHEIQIPASRLLNFIQDQPPVYSGKPSHGLEQYLETIEPYSENPKLVKVGGKPIWLQGY